MWKNWLKCDKGYKDGSCCCNCQNQLELFKHPWNKNELLNGRCSETTGLFVCMVEHDIDHNYKGTIHEFKHGSCELHLPKNPIKEKLKRILKIK